MAKTIQENAGDSRTLFKVVNNAVKGKQETPLPEHTDDGDLVNDFNHIFTKKLQLFEANLTKITKHYTKESHSQGHP